MSSDNMQENFKKFYKPTLFFFIVVIFILAIAGAAITTSPAAVEEAQAGDVGASLTEVARSLKIAQDLFITTIVFSLFALFLGGAAHMGHGSNSTKYEVNEKRDKEKKGVDNSGFDGKKETDIEKGDEKDEKWKNNYVPYDEESNEDGERSYS